jgi:hypothetical protein
LENGSKTIFDLVIAHSSLTSCGPGLVQRNA